MFEDKPLDEEHRRRVVKHKGGGALGGGPRRSESGSKPGFVILRTAKIKTLGSMGGSLQHTFRERETLNADDRRRGENQILVGPDSTDAVLQAWRDQAPEKVRKNAVLGIEYLVTASPEAMARMSRPEQDQYFARAVDWLKERHGSANVLSAVVHRDETTPHLTAMVIPKDGRGKLNAREFLGGRQKLREMQTEFTDRVGRAHGLERGIEGSKARHNRVKSYYAALSEPEKGAVRLPERRTGGILGRDRESDAEYRERASAAATAALRASQDRARAANLALQRENEHLRTQNRLDTLSLDAAQRAEEARKAEDRRYRGRATEAIETAFDVAQTLDEMRDQPDLRDPIMWSAVEEAVTRLELSAGAEGLSDLTDRIRGKMRALGWRERVEEEDRPTQSRTDRSQQNPEPSRERGGGRER